ncbi:MAG: phosphoribosylaminoimidazolesuccinocarboxamide synthase [Victivallales bacterium]|nr:phosphoribosylaminoimidazolesuccinocarboxamide synthase [Victivallales bacterium]
MKYDKNHALLSTAIPDIAEPSRGKVRDVYDLGDRLLFIATDRISAFDCVMPNGVPGKGKVLTQLSLFWFKLFGSSMPNHLITADVEQYPDSLAAVKEDLRDRSMIVKKLKMLPVECIVRGYLAGSGWKEYQKSRTVTGIPLREGYVNCSKLDEPIFTPTTKEESGHDMAINFQQLTEIVGAKIAAELRDATIRLYKIAAEHAIKRGIIIADTKFEFGLDENGTLVLADEVLTPDSSRFWPADSYTPGANPPSLDKQYVRDWLDEIGFNHQPPAPELPDNVVAKTQQKYADALKTLAD